MKKRLLERLEKWWAVWSTLKWLLLSTALFWALSWSPTEAWARTVSSGDDGVKVTAVTQPWTEAMRSWREVTQLWEDVAKSWTEVKQQKDTISLEDAIEMMKDEETYVVEKGGPWIEPGPDWEPWILTHWFVQAWSSVVPDFAEICSDKPALMIGIDATHEKTWLWVTVIRLDDFHKDPKYPVSRATVVSPHRWKSFVDGRVTVWVEGEVVFIDALPDAVWVTAKVVWSYSIWDGWTLDWMYAHSFEKWGGSDWVRLWISKKIDDALRVTAQWWYKTDYEGKFFGRVIADVDLWGWFWAQLSCIAKDWKLTPTAWIIYSF